MYRAYLVTLLSHYIFWTPPPPLPGMIGDSPYSFGPDSFVEPGVNVGIWSSHPFLGKFLHISEFPRGSLLQTHFMDALVCVGGVFSGHYLVNGRAALLTTLF